MTEKIKTFSSKYFTHQNTLVVSLLLSLVLISFLNLSLLFYNPPKQIEAKVDNVSYQIEFWTNFLELHPTYFDGWVELTNLYVQKGNLIAASNTYQNAYKINPNSEKLVVLQLKLGCSNQGYCEKQKLF